MPSRDPKDLCVTLQIFWPKLKAWYEAKFPERRLMLSWTHRTPAEQLEMFKRNKPGSILTRCDGYKKLSKHNYFPAHALDVFVIIGGKSEWDESFYMPLRQALIDLGYDDRIVWGGNWVSFKGDVYHFEMRWPKDYAKTD